MGNLCIKGGGDEVNRRDSNKSVKSLKQKDTKPPSSKSVAQANAGSSKAPAGGGEAKKEAGRVPVNFTSARLHFLWKLNRTDEADADKVNIGQWRRRIYYIQHQQIAGAQHGFLLYGSEKDEKVAEFMTLAPSKYEVTLCKDSIGMDIKSKPSYEKRLFDDEQYELAFLQRKTNLKREFPATLHPFLITAFNKDGSVDQTVTLACEEKEDQEKWVEYLKAYNPR